jgi:hypothetical protein
VYAKLFGFMAFLAGSVALAIGGTAREDWRIYSTGTPTPVDMSLADLETDGGRHSHVHVTDLSFGQRYAIDTRYGRWTCVWIPLISRGRVRAVVVTTDVKDEEQLREFCSRPDVTGVITNNPHSLSSAKVVELQKSYPGIHFSSLPVIHTGRPFPTEGSIWRSIGATAGLGALAAVTGLAALVIALRQRQRGQRHEAIEPVQPALLIGEGAGAPRPADPTSEGVTVAPARALGEGSGALWRAELPRDAVVSAPGSSGGGLGALRRSFQAGNGGLMAAGWGAFILLFWGSVAVFALDRTKPDQLFTACAGVGVSAVLAAIFVVAGVSTRGVSAALYAEGVVSKQWSRATPCRWDEVESVAGMLHVLGQSNPRQTLRILRLRTVDGRTLTFGGVRDMDELAAVVYHEVLRRQLPRALAALRRGETVSVGPLRLRGDGIGGPGEQWLAWDDVEEVAVRGKNIVVRQYGARGPWWSGESETPNAALLLELATACRRGELG